MRSLWDFCRDPESQSEIRRWMSGLSVRDRVRLEHKLDYVMSAGIATALKTRALAGPLKGFRHLYKIRASADSALRVIACRGPQDMDLELTLLVGAEERDDEFVPGNALWTAEQRRLALKDNLSLRCLHYVSERSKEVASAKTARPGDA